MVSPKQKLRRGAELGFLSDLLHPAASDDAALRARSAAQTVDWLRVVRLAGHHLVTPALWPALVGLGLESAPGPDLAGYLGAIHGLNVRRNRRITDQAKELAAALAPKGLEPVFLKGTALLLLGLHSDPGERFCGDIDVLIAPGRLRATAAALEAIGYRVAGARPDHAHDLLQLVHPARPALVELHQTPLSACYEAILPAAEMYRRSRPANDPAGLRVPGRTDLAVHMLAHAMLQHHGWRLAELPLRDALDLALLPRRFEDAVDWRAVAGRLGVAQAGSALAAFPAAVVADLFPEISLPAPEPGLRVRFALWQWRRRRGRPPHKLRHGVVHMLEFAEDLSWRIAHVPCERRRLVGLACSPWLYPDHVRRLIRIARGGPPIPFPGRRRTAAISAPLQARGA